MTLFFAVVLHAILILGVSFSPTERADTQSNTLDIILVQHKTQETPEDADYLAQADQDGGGESTEQSRPATPTPAPFTAPEPAVAAASPPVEASEPVAAEEPEARDPQPAPREAAPKPMLAQTEAPTEQEVSEPTRPEPEPRQEPEPESRPKPEPAVQPAPTKTLEAATLVSRSLAMASLSAEIDRKMKAYAERPRRKWINARTREYKYASYMEAWRTKVERIGNLNYPDEARRRKLWGALLLDVALNADGSINEITLRRSSGHRVLDDAAMRIVRLAAPFAPFPKSIREETDILHIERTWQFLNSNRLAAR
ncbi:MAG: TonB family protein [Gammaproteobacteria bacterium]|nr:TonB family protein [Gammaproteobacteria bacterium]